MLSTCGIYDMISSRSMWTSQNWLLSVISGLYIGWCDSLYTLTFYLHILNDGVSSL